MSLAVRFPAFALGLLLMFGAEALAMSCAQGPLIEDAELADAIFTGRITAVRYRGFLESSAICATHRDGERCGEKVAEIAVERVWKGDPGDDAYVYSEDGCYCLGGYFSEGAQMVFMVVRPNRRISGLGPIEYSTAFCGRNVPLEYAIDEGIIDTLDDRFPDAR